MVSGLKWLKRCSYRLLFWGGGLLLLQSKAIAQVPLHWGFVHFPPFYYQIDDGKAGGYLADFVAELMAELGRDYTFEQYPNRRMIHLLNEGELDFALVMTSVLKDHRLYRISQRPVTSMQLSAFWLGERSEVERVGDLFGSRVILMSGFSYGGMRNMLEPGYGVVREVVEVNEHALGIEALRLNRGDYLLNYKETATLQVAAEDVADIRHSVLSTINVHFLLRADLADSEALMHQIEQFLSRQ
ncbi:substrate-binding periplasmic protein [Alkalimonas amylolytica]|uniref:Amino acid ABC transporter substrate-binding protein, PAAT family n=1 Tax=Alkalimonas amylolytica TaxID=152573 RepID=A0A1H3ZGI7_ALKAM|nr:transporter substrate-binding domain-containing protein [Alkalimonas amylolytica]SEA22896.1 amino acid ABC transporter substrate-binding protein, PAAT family [Alkalimonas amylolytica]